MEDNTTTLVKNETEEDLINEESIITQFCNRFSLFFYKLPVQYRLDFVISNSEKIIAFAEVKNRNLHPSEISTIWLSLAKYKYACELSQLTHLPALFIVRLADNNIYFTALNNLKKFDLIFSGRTEARSDQEYEPLIAIPIEHFKKIEV